MSELINNREHAAQTLDPEQTRRMEELKSIIKDLHAGANPAEVKERFREAVGSVEVEEISKLEETMMREEGIPVSEVQRLCSVHASIFEGSISDIHRSAPSAPEEQPGHPVHTFKLENRELERLTGFSIGLHLEKFLKDDSDKNRFKLVEDLNLLLDVDKHYSRKENLLFPYLERYGIYGPTQVMWGVDDGIRAAVKEAKRLLTEYDGDREKVRAQVEYAVQEVDGMVFKEENILLPMALKKLTEDEWVKIADETEEIGYCLIPGTARWTPARAAEPGKAAGTPEAAAGAANAPQAPAQPGRPASRPEAAVGGPAAGGMPAFAAEAAASGAQMPKWVADMLAAEAKAEAEAAKPEQPAQPAGMAEQAAKMAAQAAEMARQAAEMAAFASGQAASAAAGGAAASHGTSISSPPKSAEPAAAAPITDGYVRFATGILSVQQLELIMNHLPVDLTFIDENDIVRYFSHGKERIFARTKAVIGRSVQNCHPPQSVHVVEELLNDFKAGRKDHEDFWIPVKDKFVYIRYFAIRDGQGSYLGTLEFTQNIAPIRELEGQKRILSEI
ncbi:DUF438 domain-containing protein [Saccharibacillus sp. CPCC 101409]|uniref:DUF438 domain-containing protein n=1 Tax=Saccharibacillus sp. CPCC 101409 TaxID=3058041 RepID=UPI002671865C|nr:DUF438 domain-containing protein [Saccharibacillus sp. CPCC 101409]MDO3413112.1 DUF438 domain-containing protein [Saccharibacillus sp. CPCC 101409]